MAVGFAAQPTGTIHVTAPTPRRSRRGFIVHSADLPRQDRGAPDGVPATAVPRTMLDLAARVSPAGLERILERAEELRELDLVALDELLGRTRGHPGHAGLRRALEIYRPAPEFTRSGLERRFLELVRVAGLPEPAMNYNVGGLEVDAFWERERFVVELDVYETHGSHAAFERDRLRQEDLKLKGVEMIRITGPRLDREPKAIVARVAAHLARRRRELSR
jgi:hypothetical protein